MRSSRDVGGSADNLEEAETCRRRTTAPSATPTRTEGFPVFSTLTSDELHRRLIEALRVLAFGTPLEREAFFGEPVHVNAHEQRASDMTESPPSRRQRTAWWSCC
jgi:hypothetical protein